MLRFLSRSIFSCTVFLAIAASSIAQTEHPAETAAVAPRPTLLSRVQGLFDFDLPELDPPGTFKLTVHPHLGDLLHRDYLRVTGGLQWALNDRFELRTEADFFGNHGLRHGTSGYGAGQLHSGAKYVFPKGTHPDFETSVGLNVDTPVGRPPFDFTDGHNHYSPYIVLQHHTNFDRHLTTFGGVSLDFLTLSSVPGAFGRNAPHDDSASLNIGGIYDLGAVKWTLTGTYTTTALSHGSHENFFTLRPSLLWFVPKKYLFNGKTQWIVGLGLRSTWGPDGYELSTSSRVRAELTFGQVIQQVREMAGRKK